MYGPSDSCVGKGFERWTLIEFIEILDIWIQDIGNTRECHGWVMTDNLSSNLIIEVLSPPLAIRHLAQNTNLVYTT